MRKLIIIRSNANGLGQLLKEGSEAAIAKLPPPDPNNPDKKRRVILITPEGSSDEKEKTVKDVLSDPALAESEKPAKKKRHLKQLFTKAIASGASIVIIDNGTEIVVTEEECKSDGKTFEYEGIQFVSIEEIVPNQNGNGHENTEDQTEKKRERKWGLF